MIVLELRPGYSRAFCTSEFRSVRNCIRSWSLRQLRKIHPKHSSINTMNDKYVNPSRPIRRNNLNLKLGVWNVESIGKDDKLLSILGDETARSLNILI